MAASPTKRFWLLAYPRTASNLLIRILNLDEQDEVYRGAAGNEYFFLPTLGWKLGKAKLAHRPISEWSAEEEAGLSNAFETCYEHLEEYLRDAQAAGKSAFVKEHVPWLADPIAESKISFGIEYGGGAAWVIKRSGTSRSQGNETVLSDDFLRIWHPTFLIRHPALVFPSLYRTGLNIEDHKEPLNVADMTIHWSKSLYDWYVRHGTSGQPTGSAQQWPIVLDADDIMTTPELVKRYAGLVGLDESKLKFEWEAATTAELDKMPSMEKRMLITLNSSSKIVQGKTSMGLDIAMEAVKWKQEFGDKVGSRLEELVNLAMPDFDYLKSKRLQL